VWRNAALVPLPLPASLPRTHGADEDVRGYSYAFPKKKDGRLAKRHCRIIGVVNLKP
jgi:hypothetical protein